VTPEFYVILKKLKGDFNMSHDDSYYVYKNQARWMMIGMFLAVVTAVVVSTFLVKSVIQAQVGATIAQQPVSPMQGGETAVPFIYGHRGTCPYMMPVPSQSISDMNVMTGPVHTTIGAGASTSVPVQKKHYTHANYNGHNKRVTHHKSSHHYPVNNHNENNVVNNQSMTMTNHVTNNNNSHNVVGSYNPVHHVSDSYNTTKYTNEHTVVMDSYNTDSYNKTENTHINNDSHNKYSYEDHSKSYIDNSKTVVKDSYNHEINTTYVDNSEKTVIQDSFNTGLHLEQNNYHAHGPKNYSIAK
jgi:hypothetical protein